MTTDKITTSKPSVDVDEQNFEQEVLLRSANVPVLVDFWATWCAPCKNLSPILDKLAHEFAGRFALAKIDTDRQQTLAMQCGIQSLPTVMLFKNGRVVDGFVGLQTESVIREMLNRHITAAAAEPETTPVAPPMDVKAGIDALRRQLGKTPDDHHLLLELARLLVMDGDYAEAEKILNRLPEDRRQDKMTAPLWAAVRLFHSAAEVPDLDTLVPAMAGAEADSGTRYGYGLRLALAGRYEEALAALLELVRRDRRHAGDGARKAMLEIFTLAGGSGPLVKQYRSLLYSALN
ncbi:MAG TPA: thioredoxin [Gammaproteobacteria bacterium]|nr:thioredoxin [Gammaproteobacteria bacterium]